MTSTVGAVGALVAIVVEPVVAPGEGASMGPGPAPIPSSMTPEELSSTR